MTISVVQGDCVEVLRARTGPLFDACVTDPPYELGFMGRAWDRSGVAFQVETWRAVFDQLKPGAHLIAFGGTRTYHRLVVAIEDAGFEIRDQLAWAYGSGFPKSLDVSKAIDKAAGAAREVVGKSNRRVAKNGNRAPTGLNGSSTFREADGNPGNLATAPATAEAAQWSGWGTALKPAWEPICLARKPLAEGTVAANVLAHGTGGLNIDACRVEGEPRNPGFQDPASAGLWGGASNTALVDYVSPAGRFPANLIHDGSDEVEALFPNGGGGDKRIGGQGSRPGGFGGVGQVAGDDQPCGALYVDSDSAARFFYSAKAGPLDRLGTDHPTVKPVDLKRWLVRMVTPPGGLLLDPFAGSGTTGIAALAEGFNAELIDLLPAHVVDIERKLAHLRGDGARVLDEHRKRKADRAKASGRLAPAPLFGEGA